MAFLTRCVLSWEANRRCEPAIHDGNPWPLNGRFYAGLIHDSSSLEPPPTGCDRITFPQSRIEARPLFCPISFAGDPKARPPCRRQTPDRRQLVDHISALISLLFRSRCPSFVAS